MLETWVILESSLVAKKKTKGGNKGGKGILVVSIGVGKMAKKKPTTKKKTTKKLIWLDATIRKSMRTTTQAYKR